MKKVSLPLVIPAILIITGAVFFFFQHGKGETIQTQNLTPQIGLSTTSKIFEESSETGNRSVSDSQRYRMSNKDSDSNLWFGKKFKLEPKCDFSKMSKNLDAHILGTEWKDILAEYPVHQYKEFNNVELEIFENNSRINSCGIEFIFTSKEQSFSELTNTEHPYYLVVSEVLRLINPAEDYSKGVVTLLLSDSNQISFMAADGPNGSLFGTYEFDDAQNSFWLYEVSAGIDRTKSPYEAADDNETCPCQQEFRIRMTSLVPVAQ